MTEDETGDKETGPRDVVDALELQYVFFIVSFFLLTSNLATNSDYCNNKDTSNTMAPQDAGR